MNAPIVKPDLTKLTDEELFDALREQVNLSRNVGGHNRAKTRAIAAEALRRGWKRPHKNRP